MDETWTVVWGHEPEGRVVVLANVGQLDPRNKTF